MACGVQKVTTSGTVTCDNAGTSSHTGQHSGTIPLFAGVSKRVWWTNAVVSPVYPRVLVVGDKD